MKFQAESIAYEFDNFRIDSGKRLLSNGGPEPIPLTPKIFDTLLYLVCHHGTVIDKDELMSAIWPDTIVEENNLNKNISVLRHVLGENPGENRYIVTVPGKGYKFVASVVESSANGIKFVDITHADITPLRSGPTRATARSKKSAFAAGGLITAVAIAVVAFGYSYFNSRRQIDSIAVMPFVNENGDAELEYLSDGMAETLINRLSQLPKLKVKAWSSVFHYKGKDTAAIGRELHVQAILNGRLVQRGDDLTLYLELVDAQTGNRIWGSQYIRKQTDIIVLQNEIARNVVDKLKIELSGADEKKLAKNYTENVEAYQLFQRGRFYWRKLTRPDIEKGIVCMQRAIDTDPSYALAYAGLAEAYGALAMAVEIPPSEGWPKAKAAAEKAIEIDDDLAEAHRSLGSALFFYDWNWTEAENQFLRALELDPNSSMTHFGYADFLFRMGRSEEARPKIKRAREIEPLSPFLNAFEAWFLIGPDPDKALDRVRFAIDLDPDFYFAHVIAAGVYKRKKMYPESIAESRRAKELSRDQTWSDVGLAGTLADTGKLDEARAILDEMLRLSESRFVPPFNIALVYNALGETDQALAWLEKGYKKRDPRMTFLKTDGRLNNLREDPRFQDLMRRVGF
ncbi:MAG TPA: winged helix-turn-helix domain-containing protein [Pyrinomonadaceae bacterium]|jgi:TolB-like protein/DNA-binding winged helix-turn-helix (wHTH) protein/Flp pilus assembly protein TadD